MARLKLAGALVLYLIEQCRALYGALQFRAAEHFYVAEKKLGILILYIIILLYIILSYKSRALFWGALVLYLAEQCRALYGALQFRAVEHLPKSKAYSLSSFLTLLTLQADTPISF